MKAQFGFIGTEEIKKAKEELISQYRFDDGSWMHKNIWFEKPHTGNYVKGYAYDDVEEVLENETSYVLDIFQSITQVEDYMNEFEYIFSDKDMETFRNIFKEDKTAYMIDGEIGHDKEYLCWSRIEDGQYKWSGTVEEAYTILDEWTGCDNANQYTELIAVGM